MPMAPFSRSQRGLHLLEPLAHVGQFLLDVGQVLFREGAGLLLERGFLDFVLHDLAGNFVQLRGHGVDLGADHRAGLVHEVDGLVGQEAVGHVAVTERGRGDQRLIGDF